MPVHEYFESIKHDKAKLRQFLADMPKGADLHNHLTGAAYAETLFNIAYRERLYVNMDTGKLVKTPNPHDPDAGKYIQLTAETFAPDAFGYKKHDFHFTRMSLIDKWSVRDFQPYKYPLGPDEYFFSLFGNFIAAAGQDFLPEIVHNLKVRAKEENLQYIETMGMNPTVPPSAFLSAEMYSDYSEFFKKSCVEFHMVKDGVLSSSLKALLEKLKDIISFYDDCFNDTDSELYQAVMAYVHGCESILAEKKDRVFATSKFDTTTVSHDDVEVRLLGYASRNKDPLNVFAQLYIVHRAMSLRPNLILGCNIVAAENSENSMQYYKLHMLMFYVLRNWYKDNFDFYPNTTLHAGELTMGLIPPEQLTYHVTDALLTAGAKRIGHGVDIAFEHNSASILDYMSRNEIPVEINLTSNEFILGVKDDSHPFKIYKDSGVPIVISTDDPGILRTSITEEYALAVYRYGLTYDELVGIMRNSIAYSFLPPKDKENVRNKFERSLLEFEKKYANRCP